MRTTDRDGPPWRLRVVITLLVAAALIPIGSPAAHAECYISDSGIDYLTVSPPNQTLLAGETATFVVRAFDCGDKELEGFQVQATVGGANPKYQLLGLTPFVFTYSGDVPGQDSIRFTTAGPTWEVVPVEQHEITAVASWMPTSANIEAGGSVLKVTKNTGSPQAGAAIFECDVQAAYATEVAIETCTLLGPGGVVLATASGPIVPGPVAAISGVIPTIDSSSFDVCWLVRATFTTGLVKDAACTPVLVNENV